MHICIVVLQQHWGTIIIDMPSTIPNTRRFFVSPDVVHGETVLLTNADIVHQINRVLRLLPNDHIVLLDGLGYAYTVCLTAVDRRSITGHVEHCEQAGGEPTTQLTLYVALIRAERFEWVLQKGTELGVCRFVPLVCTNAVVDAEKVSDTKVARWQKILREAAEQSCRGKIPDITPPHDFASACTQAATADLRLVLQPEGTEIAEGTDRELPSHRERQHIVSTSLHTFLHTHAPYIQAAHPSIAVFSGPEGGMTHDELTTATRHGIIPISLGPRILRAETAPIAAAAAILYEMER